MTWVIMGPMMLGSTSLKMMKKLPAPRVREARTNSWSFSLSISARAMRLMPTHSVSIRAKMMVIMPGCSTRSSSVTMTRRGMPLATSRKRCISISTLPPK